MNKKRMIAFAAVASIVLCACGSSGNSQIEGFEELTQPTEIVESHDAEKEETESATSSTDTLEDEVVDTETNASQVEVVPIASIDTFEYDATNNCVILDGYSYYIAANEMDCHAGYMFYWLTNGTMEDIRDSINNNVLENKYWRESYTEKLLEKVKESTMLEDFTENGGKILNYYILNAPGFVHGPRWAEMPVVVEYSFNGETYHTIWVFYVLHKVENEDVLYQITDITYLDAMNGWGLED